MLGLGYFLEFLIRFSDVSDWLANGVNNYEYDHYDAGELGCCLTESKNESCG